MRREALDEHFAFDITPSGASGDLRDQLERALASPKIRNVQAQVRVDDSHERDIRKVQSLGDHLRADEDVDLREPEIAQNAPVIFFAFENIAVHALNRGMRKQFPQRFLHLLGA